MKTLARRGFWSTLLSPKRLTRTSQPNWLGRRVSVQRSLRLEPCEVRTLMAADITGLKLEDLTGDGFSADDTPLAGVTIELYEDNGDGVFDPNVDTLFGTQVTGADGRYTFAAVPDGRYYAREVVPPGFFQTGGPAFYTFIVDGADAYTLDGIGVDNFDQPDPPDVYFINALDPDPTLIKHDVSGVVGGQRDVLIDVIGVSNPLSANVVVGFDGTNGLFSFGSASPGTSATFQYDGVDADVTGPPAALTNAQGLSVDLTNGGLATAFLLDFDSIDPGLGTALGVEIRLTSAGGGTATFTDTTTFLESIGAVNHFVPFASFTTANGFTFEDVTSIEMVFNGAGVQDVDFDLDQLLTVGREGDFANAALSSLSGFVYVDANNDGVFQPGETPIPNVTVTLTGTDDLGAAVNIVDQTDANGQYLFENLRPGDYTITETQPAGFLDGKDTIGTPGGTTGQDVFSDILLPVNFAGVNNNFGELLPSSLSGFVYVDANNDGVFQPGETPIPNVTVTLTGTDDLGAAVNIVDQTDANGQYLFETLRPGTYTITETQPAGFLDGKDTIGTPGGTTGQDVFSNIILPQDFDGVNNNFGELLPSSLSGFVYVDANNDGVFQPGETPIPNVTVTLTGTDDLGAAVNIVDQTDANGQYLFETLRPGTYTITETQPAGFLDGKDTIGTPGGTTSQDVFSNIILPQDFDGVNNNFGELLPSSLSGFVYVDANNDGVFQPGETPIPNVTVTLTGTDDLGAAVNIVDQTDANGQYLFETLRPGTYTITETQPAGFLDGKDTIGTPGGTTGQDVFSNIILPQDFDGVNNNFGELLPSSLSGFVYVDANNDGVFQPGETPIPNVTVTLTGTDDLGAAVNIVDQTDANGQYLFETLRPGTYTITETQPAGFLDGKDTIGTPGGTTGQDVFSNIILPQDFDGVNNNFGELLPSSLSGFVYVDANNDGVFQPGETPIPNVTVTLTGTDDLGAAVNIVDQTDANGQYLFETLRPGTYTITETQPAGFLDGKDTIGTPGGTTGQDVFSNIVLVQDFDGVNNNFGELLPSSLSGFVYIDEEDDGQRGNNPGIPNVTITLTGTDDLGAQVNTVVQTDASGFYIFPNLRPGTYAIQETQPAGFADGKDTIGTPGGDTAQDLFFNIVLPQDFDGVENNFGELQEIPGGPSSLSGYVYVDVNNNGVKEPQEFTIGNVTIRLTGTDNTGAAVDRTTLTAVDGLYIFTNLQPGTYSIIETQPAGFLDGKDTIGTPGGDTGQDIFFNIVLPAGFDGVNNNFGERGLENPSKNLLLASTPVPPDLSNLGVVIGAPAGAVNNSGLVAQAAPANGANAAWFDAVYDEVLGRDPSAFEVNRQAAELGAGQTTYRDIAEDLLLSRERKSDIITGLYEEYLGRAPDAAGMEFWLGIWDRFNGPERVQSGIIGSPEYYQTAGGTDQAWVSAMYQNILGRTAVQSEIDYHVNRLKQPGVNLQSIVLGFVYSDEFRSGMISDWYFDYLARAPEQGGVNYWLNQMKNGQSQESIQAGLLGSQEYLNNV